MKVKNVALYQLYLQTGGDSYFVQLSGDANVSNTTRQGFVLLNIGHVLFAIFAVGVRHSRLDIRDSFWEAWKVPIRWDRLHIFLSIQ